MFSAYLWFVYGTRKRDKTIYLACIGWIVLDAAIVIGAIVQRWADLRRRRREGLYGQADLPRECAMSTIESNTMRNFSAHCAPPRRTDAPADPTPLKADFEIGCRCYVH